MPKTMKIRRWIIVLLVLAVLGIFAARLMNIQIIDYQTYRDMLDKRYISTQTVRATRGEVVDRNGNPLAVNRMGYDVIFDKAFLPDDRQNEIILSLITLFEKMGEDWNDNLPITKKQPFAFLPEHDSQVAALKEHVDVAAYTNATDTLYWLSERYLLQDYTPIEQRKIASVRYEMERRGFALNVPYTFSTDIDISSVVQVKEKSHELLGVNVTESAIRSYSDGTIAPHIIGTIGPMYAEEYQVLKDQGYAMDDTIGKSGVELAFESTLRGENGTREIYIDSRGEVISAVETQPPVPGNTVMLTLDTDMQQVSAQALEKQIINLQTTASEGKGKEANAGSVVVIDPKTGEVLAAVTYPSYDLNTYRQEYASLAAQTELAPLLNRALMGQYNPGSTFKPAVATAGFAYNIIDASSPVNCTHVYTFYTGYQPTCMGYHGSINVLGALRVSCNIFFYDVGRRLGIDNMNTTVSQYGLGQPTGIEIAENVGVLSSEAVKLADPNTDEPWYPGDVLQSSIGQLYNEFSPLQLANYVATVGNRGKRMKVSIVKEIRDYSMNTVITPFEAQIADQVVAPSEAFDAVIAGMVSASRVGTAAAYFGSYPIDVASKTGTPETSDANLLNSTFICFAPADDPQIAIAVVIEKGYHGYTGAPVAKDIMDYYFGYNQQTPQSSASSETASQESDASTDTTPDVPLEENAMLDGNEEENISPITFFDR